MTEYFISTNNKSQSQLITDTTFYSLNTAGFLRILHANRTNLTLNSIK